MTEPITTNISLIVPNTGDLSAAWGTSALNPNFQSIDTKFGGVTTISLSSATTILLTVPATTGVWPGGNPSQSMNSMIRFTGAQTGSATITFTLPGFYIIDNQCTGTTFVRLWSVAAGNSIGAIPGKKCHVFYDGTDMDYVDMPEPGTACDLHTNTLTLPPWTAACTKQPYLVKDGTVYNVSTYPALGQLLGSTYGGNGVTTFAVPDERNRFRLAVDTGSNNRVTAAISGITGTAFNSAGGSESLQAHRHINTLSDPGHTHQIKGSNGAGGTVAIVYPQIGAFLQNDVTGTATTGITLSNVTTGVGGAQNMPPTIVSFLPLIKT